MIAAVLERCPEVVRQTCLRFGFDYVRLEGRVGCLPLWEGLVKEVGE